MKFSKAAACAFAAAGRWGVGAPAPAATIRIPYLWKNCTHVHGTYRHGVAKLHAHDHTSSGNPVTTFRRSTRLYNIAMHWNRGLDADHDGIACEKH
jgi:hypothetical protein